MAEAETGEQAIEAFRLHQPDVTLVDLQMPGTSGFDTIAAIRSANPGARILVLTAYGGDGEVTRTLRSGASGYVLKTASGAEILAAIRSAHQGQRYLLPQVAQQLASHVTDDPLAAREIGVLRCVVSGMSNLEIARQLFLAEETIKSWMKNILSKLRARDRTHAATIAISRGLFDGP